MHVPRSHQRCSAERRAFSAMVWHGTPAITPGLLQLSSRVTLEDPPAPRLGTPHHMPRACRARAPDCACCCAVHAHAPQDRCAYRRVLSDDGRGRRRVRVAHEASWRFLLLHGTFTTK